jgi:putative membrane protein
MVFKKQTVLGVLAATAAVTAVPSAWAQSAAAPDTMFIKTASMANVAEVQTAQLALKKTQNAEVRQIAQTIITDHSKAEAQLKTLAAKHNVPAPQTPDAKHKAMAAKLATLSGTAFDKAYLQGQMADHKAAIALFTKEKNTGKWADIRSFAAATLPHIEMHTTTIVTTAANTYKLPVLSGLASYNKGTSSAGSASMPMHKMGSMNKMGGKMGGTFTPAPRATPSANPSPAPGIH